MSDQYLAHHGVLGMKWGVRRYQPYPDGHIGGREAIKKKTKRQNTFDRVSRRNTSVHLKEARQKDINEMSNKELKDYNERLKLENEFANLTSGSINSGKQFVNGMGKQITTAIITGVAIGAGQQFLKKKLGLK